MSLVSLFGLSLGVFNARRTAAVVSIDLPIAGLPAALQGFTIAQIRDIHGHGVPGSVQTAWRASEITRLQRFSSSVEKARGLLHGGKVLSHMAELATGQKLLVLGKNQWPVSLPSPPISQARAQAT